MQYKEFTLDKFQEDAIKAINENKSVVVSAPTGSGKTLIADYIIDKDLQKNIKVIYTAPIKALSNQKYKEFCKLFGEYNIGLLTGDVSLNPTAPILIMTTEVYRNMALVDDESLKDVSYVIFDEVHYINDIERGYVWEESVIFSKENVRFLCLSATIPNADEFASWIQAVKKHKVEVIHHTKRNVPLKKMFFDAELGICSLEDIKEVVDIPTFKRGRFRRQKIIPPNHIDLVEEIALPCFFFDFSRKNCQNKSLELYKARKFKLNPEIQKIIREKLKDSPEQINNLKSTQVLKKTLPYGIGFHHAGLLPIMKELVEELFGEGLINVLYTTETFAVGINMPAKTVCFAALRKYDGINFRFLNSKEYFQIAGRAGRRGIDKIGFSYAMVDRRDFDYNLIRRMTEKDVDPIKSQFRLSVNTVLNIFKRHDDKEIKRILTMNFDSYQKYGDNFAKATKTIAAFKSAIKKLRKKKYIEDDELTYKGNFASRIYADEIITAEVFATDFYKKLNEYQVMLILCSLAYESRDTTKIYKTYQSKDLSNLRKKVKLLKSKKFDYLKDITTFVDPVMNDKNIFDVIDNTNLLEGDIIRLFRQILDKVSQIKKATHEHELGHILDGIAFKIDKSMEDIDVI
tara:strand:+ start:174 stop:2060 length:1887 start_codon:yes stop_codon:yes gene_type:complete